MSLQREGCVKLFVNYCVVANLLNLVKDNDGCFVAANLLYLVGDDIT